mgnify:CR=1 FL=1|tara:strand:- start:45 stop:446 length:402 start_codon:yes stop_codon:yes gene_type:complete
MFRKLFRDKDRGTQKVELQDFVHQSLVQIAKGIAYANKDLSSKVEDVESHYLMENGKNDQNTQVKKPHTVSFDIAVTSASKIDVVSGVSSKIYVADANVEGSLGRETKSVSRVQFEVIVNKTVGYKQSIEDRT